MTFSPPQGFVLEEIGPAQILVDATRRDRLMEDGLGRTKLLRSGATPREGGRGGTFNVTLGGEDLVLRIHRRGGLVRLFLRERTFDRDRSLREVAALVAARARGVPAVEPVAAISVPAGFGLYRHLLLTVEETGAVDLLAAASDRSRTPAERADAIESAGRTVHAAFEAGIEHVDLHPRNLLVLAATPPRCLLVDLDRARVRAGPLPPATRLATLARFARYFESHPGLRESTLTRADLARFFRAVGGPDWKHTAREVESRVRRSRWLHVWSRLRRREHAPRGPQAERLRAPAGPPAPLDPEVTFVAALRGGDETRRAIGAVLSVASAAGLGSFEIVAAPRDEIALEELRALALTVPSLRFTAAPAPTESAAWRSAFRGARGARVVVVNRNAFDPRFLTEALERLEDGADVVVGARGRPGSKDQRTLGERVADAARARVARWLRPVRVLDPFASFVVRRDDRLDAEVRALESRLLVMPTLLARLVDAGAKPAEAPVDAPRRGR